MGSKVEHTQDLTFSHKSGRNMAEVPNAGSGKRRQQEGMSVYQSRCGHGA